MHQLAAMSVVRLRKGIDCAHCGSAVSDGEVVFSTKRYGGVDTVERLDVFCTSGCTAAYDHAGRDIHRRPIAELQEQEAFIHLEWALERFDWAHGTLPRFVELLGALHRAKTRKQA